MKTVLSLIILTSSVSFADSGDEAFKKTTEAFSKTETGKEMTKNLERIVNSTLPVEKNTAAVIGSVAITAAQGKVSTGSIKNMNISIDKGSLRPDVEYDFKDNNSSVLLKYNLNF